MPCPHCQHPVDAQAEHCLRCGLALHPLDQTTHPADIAEATRPPKRDDGRPDWSSGALPTQPMVRPGAVGSLLANTTLGTEERYRITGLIGQGGFAETFHAIDTQLFDAPCVIKRLRYNPNQSAQVQAIQRTSLAHEASLLVALKTPGHPNIPEVYAYLEDECCLVMKYVEGQSLAMLLDQRSTGLAEDEALRYAHDTCSALAYMHARGTLHLDVKPANLLCDSSNRLWLIDFGIGRSLATPGGTESLGTPGYAPLEQWRGQPEPRSDIYALGVTLHVLLTNRRPTSTDQMAALLGKARSLPPIRRLVPKVRPEVELLVQRATDPDPAKRPSAADMLDELRRLRSGLGVPRPARPPNLGQFCGRAAELDQVWHNLQTSGGCVVIGMPGIGKTALAAALARRFGRHEHIFWHTFQPTDRFERLLWALAGFLAWDGQPELWALLQQAGANGPPPQVLLDYLLGQLHQRPYLICLDDLHHTADDPLIAQWIAGIAPLAQPGGPQLLITTRRQPAQPWPKAYLNLTGLEHADAHDVLAQTGRALSAELRDRLILITEANPQLLILAADALQHTNSPAALIARLAESEHIERYLIREVDAGLSSEERAVLQAIAALLGAPGHRELLEAMLGSGLRRPLLALRDRRLIVTNETEQGVAYTQHALLQTFYESDMAAAQRRMLHERAAAYLEPDPQATLWAARHYAAAGAYPQAAILATQDLWGSVNRGQAEELLTLVAQLPSAQLVPELRLQLSLAHGELATLLADSVSAQSAFEAASELLPTLTTTTQSVALTRICKGMGELLESQLPQQARAWLERGLQALGEEQSAAAAPLKLRLGSVLIAMGDNEGARAALIAGLDALPLTEDVQRADALGNLATIAWMQGQSEQAEAFARETLELYERTGQHWKMVTIWQNLGIGKYFAGDWPGAAAEYARALEVATTLGSTVRQTELALCLGMLALNQGDYPQATTQLATCVELARRHHLNEQLSLGLSSLADLYLRTNSLDAAASALNEALTIANQLDLRYQLSELVREQAELLLAQGQAEAAMHSAEEACRYAHEQMNPREEGISLRVLGQALATAGHLAEAEAHFAQSVALLDPQDPYEAARTRLAWGANRRTANGMALLRQAAERFAQLGARNDLELCLKHLLHQAKALNRA
jgi:ATP/maltotriose-dependent transcriptional regulator MalT/tRNA A-37 threonylcarbamoyl transferase component Bud32